MKKSLLVIYLPVKMNKKYLSRSIDPLLTEWKAQEDRKPLLLRGARQVGKSSLIRAFSKQFDYFLEINFEERRDIHALFQNNLNSTS